MPYHLTRADIAVVWDMSRAIGLSRPTISAQEGWFSMKKFFFLLLFIPTMIDDDEITGTFWSYACEKYIYVFDTINNTYKIYSRIDAEGSVSGKYTPYLLTEGTLSSIGPSLYSLTSKDMPGAAEADFSQPGAIAIR